MRREHSPAGNLMSRLLDAWAFTLIELLVVIVIIGLLAGLLLPALMAARSRARRASCKNQIHQFAIAVDVYRNDYPDFYPPWLSTLYPIYIGAPQVYICPNDPKRGEEGAWPQWFSDSRYGASQFAEIDDTKKRDDELDDPGTITFERPSDTFIEHEKEAKKPRNHDLHACSYAFEFAVSPCSWWYNDDASSFNNNSEDYDANRSNDAYKWADFDNNGYVSWREAKRVDKDGLGLDGTTVSRTKEPYGGHVPMVRCFWHCREGKVLDQEIVISLACENKNIYESAAHGDGWKNAIND